MCKGVEDIEQLCLECGYKCINRRSLGNHLAHSHKNIGGMLGYVLKHFLNNVIPLCCCGCGKEVTWHKLFYKFNDFVSGHNASGFRTSQPKFTKEQIALRNASIKESYNDPIQGKIIRDKISRTVNEAYTNPGYKSKLSSASRQNWKDPEYRIQAAKIRKHTWETQHDELCTKIFTKEMRKKISLSNLTRSVKKTSAVELEFVEHLKNVFGNVESSKWFNFSERTWCADVWLPDYNAIVEFDGMYWHGLDREEDFTIDQIKNIANDIRKNALARTKGLTLLRIKESSDWKSISSWDDLKSLAYHFVDKGEIISEGTRKLEDDTNIVLKETILLAREKNEGALEWIGSSLLPVVAELLRAHVEYHGWFYPQDWSEQNVCAVLEKLREEASKCSGEYVSTSATGSSWLKSFVGSFWNVDNGPVKQFYDDNALVDVMAYRFGLNNSKLYQYTLSDGRQVHTNETFDINIKNIRRGFIVQRRGVSWFRPTVAAEIYKRFIGNIECPTVWDPSIGFSARLLGFASIFPYGKYIGTDPAVMMCDDARALVRLLPADLSVDIMQCGSEFFVPKPNTLDFVFTSPPYFDMEKYIDEPGQCWRDYQSLDLWTKNYLIPTFKNAYIGLKTGNFMVININEQFADECIIAAMTANFTERKDLQLKLPLKRDHFSRKVGSTVTRSEPILIFQK